MVGVVIVAMDDVADPDDDAPGPVGTTMEGSSFTIVDGGPRRSDASPGNNTSGDTTPGDTEHADALYGPDDLREVLATAASIRKATEVFVENSRVLAAQRAAHDGSGRGAP